MGEVWEWQPATGWSKVPGSEMSGPNGLLVSEDGRWFYIGGHTDESVIRLSRGQTPVRKDEVGVGFQVDNLRWAPDGSVLAAGQAASGPATVFDCVRQGDCDGLTSRVARVDPQALTAEEIVSYPSNEFVILGTGAIQVGEEIWLGAVGGGNRIARFTIQ
jgi:sugar lactone lactonase YvrE